MSFLQVFEASMMPALATGSAGLALWVISAGALGAAAGRGLRRLVPPLLRLRRRELPFRGPWLEIAGAVGWAVVVWRLGPVSSSWIELGVWLLFTTLLLAVCATDYLVKLIPDSLTLGGAALGVAVSALAPGRIADPLLHRWLLSMLGLSPEASPLASGAVLALMGAALGFVVLEAIRRLFGLLVGLEPMGMGDSKLLAAIGAFLGPQGVATTLPLGLLLGVVHGVVLQRVTGLPHSPFGPPLAAAAWLVALGAGDWTAALGAFQSFILALPLPLLVVIYVVLIALVVGLILRTRRRAALYEEIIEDDYRRLEDRLDD